MLAAAWISHGDLVLTRPPAVMMIRCSARCLAHARQIGVVPRRRSAPGLAVMVGRAADQYLMETVNLDDSLCLAILSTRIVPWCLLGVGD